MTQALMVAAAHDSLVDFPTTEHPESPLRSARAARICAGAVDLKRAPYWPLAAHRFESGEMLDAVHFAARGTLGGRPPSEAPGLRCGRVMRLISSAHVVPPMRYQRCRRPQGQRRTCARGLSRAAHCGRMAAEDVRPALPDFSVSVSCGRDDCPQAQSYKRRTRRASQDDACHFVRAV